MDTNQSLSPAALVRLEIANQCGPDSARTVPMNTGKPHGPLSPQEEAMALYTILSGPTRGTGWAL